MLNKTKIVLSAAMIVASASAGIAMPHRAGGDFARTDASGATIASRTPAAVLFGGQVVGQDPDAGVRAQLQRDAHTINR